MHVALPVYAKSRSCLGLKNLKNKVELTREEKMVERKGYLLAST